MEQLLQFPPVPETPATVSRTSGTARVLEMPLHETSSNGMRFYFHQRERVWTQELPHCSEALLYRS